MKSPLLAAAAVCALCAATAFARPPAHPTPPPSTPRHVRRPLSLEQAVKQVQHQTHGHILAADSVARGRNQVYRIKVLKPNGQVKVVQLHSNQHERRAGPPPDHGGH